MRTSTIVGVIIVLVLLGGGWYYYSTMQAPAAAGPSGALGVNGSPNQGNLGGTDTGAVQQPQGDGTDVSQNLILGISNDSDHGNYLSAYNGMSLYTYGKDSVGTTTCYGTCAKNWPPYTVPSAAAIHIPATITASNVGTVTRADGSIQVTYNGLPLYFYVKDTKPGDTIGQNVGNVWFLVKP